ncbi:MAG: hypothetical protein GX661_04745 [Acholeplasmataceae bacterium]|nr:hypothetical protein [Acholeplasmataceae bacterium]
MEERMKILEMLANGTINSQEANDLLTTLDKQKVQVQSNEGSREVVMGEVVRKETGKILHIKINSSDGDMVNINIPLAFIKAAIKAGTAAQLLKKSINPDKTEIMEQIDPDIIISSIESGVVGKIVDIKSSDGDVVEISIE